MLLSLVLYGSRARGDNREASDVDLLGLVDGGGLRQEMASNGISLYRYPIQVLRQKAKVGDLFVLHLVTEGQILHDTAGLFLSVKQSFRYSDTYEQTAMQAASIIMFLAARPRLLGLQSGKRRMIWAIRTLIIAKAAEQHIPIFSSEALAAFSGLSGLKDVIDHRITISDDIMLSTADSVLKQFQISKTSIGWPAKRIEQRDLLMSFGGIGADTVSLLNKKNQKNPREISSIDYH